MLRMIHCDNCNAEEILPVNDRPTFKVCGKCKIVHYCSVECQKLHWPEHKKICHTYASNVSYTDLGAVGDIICNSQKCLDFLVNRYKIVIKTMPNTKSRDSISGGILALDVNLSAANSLNTEDNVYALLQTRLAVTTVSKEHKMLYDYLTSTCWDKDNYVLLTIVNQARHTAALYPRIAGKSIIQKEFPPEFAVEELAVRVMALQYVLKDTKIENYEQLINGYRSLTLTTKGAISLYGFDGTNFVSYVI